MVNSFCWSVSIVTSRKGKMRWWCFGSAMNITSRNVRHRLQRWKKTVHESLLWMTLIFIFNQESRRLKDDYNCQMDMNTSLTILRNILLAFKHWRFENSYDINLSFLFCCCLRHVNYVNYVESSDHFSKRDNLYVEVNRHNEIIHKWPNSLIVTLFLKRSLIVRINFVLHMRLEMASSRNKFNKMIWNLALDIFESEKRKTHE